MTGRLLPSGERALLVEVDDLAQALALHRRLWVDDRLPGLLDAVVGARTLLLVSDSPASLRHVVAEVSGLLTVRAGSEPSEGFAPTDPSDGSGADTEVAEVAEVVEVVVRYDGPDLDEVAELTGLSRAEVVAAHTGRPWRVGFAGFAPGFAYLVDGDPRLDVPRRETPRTRVPSGSVGLAGAFSGVYPRSSPGGWQLIGHTEQVLWDLDRDPPALLRPGLVVQFTDAGGAS
ncbi:sensor histidine kinase inhibitor, KipI family [Pedococcus dokdonensis]|uniref:Sensor histidine kinase inhibitor, KipI family n=1 Tax=Pedococcus dokdonensis TaxID=443156 RepID=A0A1H0R5Q8_9MICO|nr:allophanate hydrolase subunit 1 [Pedococcus dokdonensis]SDP24760.1 sensor histidine kinase inhibitor, KipI family [Pedococcus dokdonensis]